MAAVVVRKTGHEDDEEHATAPISPTVDMVARLTMSLGLSLARVFLHTPSPVSRNLENEEVNNPYASLTGFNIADVTETLFTFASSALTRIGFDQEQTTLTGQSLAIMLRLLTQFTGPVVGLSDREVYDGLKAYIYAQTLSKSPEKVPFGAEKPNIPEFRRYMRFIMASYGALGMKFLGVLPRTDTKIWDNKKAITYLTGINADECLVDANWRANWMGSIFHPGYYILLDHQHKELIVGIRGSYRFQDALTDLMCEDEEFKFVYHRGEDFETALKSLGSVAHNAKESVRELGNNWENMTIKEFKGNLKTLASGMASKLTNWAGKQAEMVRQHVDELNEIQRLDSTPIDHRKILGRSHKGFVLAANALREEIEPKVLEALEEYPDYKVVLCGHSLGAAVSTLIALMWARVPELRDVRCYSVAQPSTVSLDIAESATAQKRITSLVLCDDVVPRLSFSNVQNLRDAIIRMAKDDAPPEFDASGNNVNQRLSLANWIIKNAETKSKGECRALFKPVLDTIRSEVMISERLYPAGKIWHVVDATKGIDGGAILKQPRDFQEIEIGSTMFLYHVPNYYAHACDPNLPLVEMQQTENNLDAEIIRRLTSMR